MLPKFQRLNLSKDFKWVALGKKLETKYLKLFLREGDNKTSRVGIAVSGKVFKKAHERNKARRLVSKAFGTIYTRLPDNLSIVALPKGVAVKVKSDEILLDLEEVLRKEKIVI